MTDLPTSRLLRRRDVRVLALDIGTSSVRAHVFGPSAVERGRPARRDYHGEVDPRKLLRLTRAAIRDAGGAKGVDAVGASCFGHSLLALGRDGQPLTPVLGWRDTRSADAVEWLARAVDPGAVHARTGCHLHTSYWPAKLAWLAKEQPRVFRRARFVSFADYLYEQLLKTEAPASLSLASGTGLLDLQTRKWDGELLSVLGVRPERLPQISDEPVRDWHPAFVDGACSNVGAGCTGRTRAALMVGTSGALRTVYETERPQPRPGLFLYRVDERRVVEGGALSDGGNLYHWLTETLKQAEGSLAARGPGSHGLTFLTLLGGERSPGWHPHASGAVAGLTLDTSAVDLRQAALEGVAFRFAEVLELMPEVEQLVATGGALVKDSDWVQIMADALARPVTLSRVKEASLRGAAVLTLERLGESAGDAPVGRVVEPRTEQADAYRAARERQRELYEVVTSADAPTSSRAARTIASASIP
jgi:gluconokinase